MRQVLLLSLFLMIIFSSCDKDKLYSYNRPFFSNSYKTRDKKDLKTAGYKDTLFVQNGEGVISAYFAIIQGEFTHEMDTIVQYGHCWSTTNQNPIITDDTNYYSRYYNWQFDSLGTFTSYLSLYPETPFYVRSYVITSRGDTGYNQEVYIDTTTTPINEWFATTSFGNGNDGREGAVAITTTYDNKTTAYLATGNDATGTFGDLWRYNDEQEYWEQMPGTLPARTEAIGFGLTTVDPNSNRKTQRIFIGTGCDITGQTIYNDFYEYSLNFYQWQRIDSFPYPVKSAVSFTIDNRAYAGTGKSYVDIGNFYMFDYNRTLLGKSPWIVMPSLGNDGVANARHDAIAFSVNDVAFVGLGVNTNNKSNQYFNDLWIFRPPDENGYDAAWGKKKDFPSYPRAEAVGFTVDRQGYVGLGADDTDYFKDLYRYDPFMDMWYQIADYKTGPDYTDQIQEVKNAVAFGIDKKGYVGTGRHKLNPKYSKEFWIYRPW